MRVLITRHEVDAAKTAESLKEQGHEPVLLPLFEVGDTGNADPSTDCEGYIFTSGNAVAVLNGRGWRCSANNAVAFCVGNKTAEGARSLGFERIVSADGNAEDLSSLLLKKYSGVNTKLLYPAGVERTFDFSNAFLGTKIDVEIAELYEIRNLVPSDLEVGKALEQLGKGAIFFYSHNTAKHVCETLFEHSCRKRVEGLSAIAISSKTAEPVLKYPWQDVYVADEPTEQSMVSKLHQVSLA